jgi:hypothetical protein
MFDVLAPAPPERVDQGVAKRGSGTDCAEVVVDRLAHPRSARFDSRRGQ